MSVWLQFLSTGPETRIRSHGIQISCRLDSWNYCLECGHPTPMAPDPLKRWNKAQNSNGSAPRCVSTAVPDDAYSLVTLYDVYTSLSTARVSHKKTRTVPASAPRCVSTAVPDDAYSLVTLYDVYTSLSTARVFHKKTRTVPASAPRCVSTAVPDDA
ncbi:hypothetical protein J6590_068444 [Homalodisca vitripennis]|nr:hypothetical protein J6590_068444 [Homalodisca vitripennis]